MIGTNIGKRSKVTAIAFEDIITIVTFDDIIASEALYVFVSCRAGDVCFIIAIGYYITPALVGGTTGTLISNFIAYHMSVSLNWGLAAALGAILLGIVLALYLLYDKIVGIDNMKLG